MTSRSDRLDLDVDIPSVTRSGSLLHSEKSLRQQMPALRKALRFHGSDGVELESNGGEYAFDQMPDDTAVGYSPRLREVEEIREELHTPPDRRQAADDEVEEELTAAVAAPTPRKPRHQQQHDSPITEAIDVDPTLTRNSDPGEKTATHAEVPSMDYVIVHEPDGEERSSVIVSNNDSMVGKSQPSSPSMVGKEGPAQLSSPDDASLASTFRDDNANLKLPSVCSPKRVIQLDKTKIALLYDDHYHNEISFELEKRRIERIMERERRLQEEVEAADAVDIEDLLPDIEGYRLPDADATPFVPSGTEYGKTVEEEKRRLAALKAIPRALRDKNAGIPDEENDSCDDETSSSSSEEEDESSSSESVAEDEIPEDDEEEEEDACEEAYEDDEEEEDEEVGDDED